MEGTLKVALGEQDHLREFFTMMKEQGQERQAEDIGQLLAQMEGMKVEFADALEEILYLREQIDLLQNQTVKAKLRMLQEEVQTTLKQAQNRALSVKKSVEVNIHDAVSAGKQKGILALDKTFDIFPIYQGLGVVEAFLEHSADTLGQRIGKVNALAEEIHEIKGHIRNAGMVVTGKPAEKPGERDHEKGILSKIEKSIAYCRKLVSNLAVKTIMAKAHIEHFRELSGKRAEEVPTVYEIAKTMREKAAISAKTLKTIEAR